jgi:two-component system CheB/CheR fusion protein
MAPRKRPTRAGGGSRPRKTVVAARAPAPDDPGACLSTQALIVGLGASAGGIEAVSQLLRALPEGTGMCFVVVQHLDPRRPSLLRDVLAQSTTMPVIEASSGMRLQAGHVYVIPPGTEMALRDRRFVIGAIEPDRKTHRSIDLFLRSLAEEEKNCAIGVVLSGTGSDGTEGLRAVRAAGGIALVEDPASARYPAMPESAIAAGAVDRVLSVPELAAELFALSRAPYLLSRDPAIPGPLGADQDALIGQVLGLVRGHSGSDFSEYKSTTFRRRLARRMLIRRTESLHGYLEVLRAEPAEVEALCRDVLIHVTEFFRDPEVFSALSQQVIPTILERHGKGQAIRVWVPGCSTGEEPYSIAIALLEALGDRATEIPVQIFATDLSGEMIDRARAGTYPDGAVHGLGSERLERFFTPVDGGGHRVNKAVRNLCVFVKHDLTRDPPFAHLDLISCRNVLIYFGAALQKRVFPLFHYCLGPGGFLLLGQAEVVPVAGLFSAVDKGHKLYAKIGLSRSLAVPPGRSRQIDGPAGVVPALPVVEWASRDIERQADTQLLGRYAPPGALVDERMDVVSLRGRTAPFLELRPGHPDLNLLALAHEGLGPALRSAFEKARKGMVTVRREAVEVSDGDEILRVNIEVMPVAGVPDKDRYFLVLFQHAAALPATATKGTRKGKGKGAAKGRAVVGREAAHRRELARLREETEATREFVQSVLAERQRMNDEVTASNEELVASNEEMQSTNEELEAAQEELQSANEELTTVNDELQMRNQELGEVNSDLVNILASVDIPIVIISGDRRVRRFTPGATAMMNLIPSDVGRSIHDIRLNIQIDDLEPLIAEVIDTLVVKQLDVQNRQGRWFRMQIRPYRTVDNRLDGVVLSLTDIDLLKQAVGSATAAFDQVTAILQTIRVPVVVLDHQLRVRWANAAYLGAYPAGAPDDLVGADWLGSSGGLWNLPVITSALDHLLAREGDIAVETELRFRDGSKRTVVVAGSVLRWAGEAPHILVTPVDVTEHAILLESANSARLEAERASKAKDLFLAMLSHELRAPLHTITLHADLLLAGVAADPARAKRAAEAIVRAASSQEQIISDLLDVSSIIAGKVSLVRRPLGLQAVVSAALDAVRERAAAKQVELRDESESGPILVLGDSTRLQQIVGNLLTNAVKFTPAGGRVVIAAVKDGAHARITVRDTGQGIAPEFLPHVFDRFAQADTSNARVHGGLGLGLAIVRDLTQLHQGTVTAESEGTGKGATFTVELPLHTVTIAEMGEETSPWGHDIRAVTAALASEERGQLRGVKVLVVDDDDEARAALTDILGYQGAEVRAVGGAADAMQALSEFRPDVLLCDIAMPDEDGFKLIRRVRALEPAEGGQTPAIAVTALATRSDRKRALEAGFQLHVAKPTKVAVVCAAVRKVYGESVSGAHRPSRDVN